MNRGSINRPDAKTRTMAPGLWLSIIALLVTATGVRGHPSKSVKREWIRIGNDKVVLLLRYEISEPHFSADLRERFDTNGDRRLVSEEQDSLEHYARMLATQDLHLRLDGAELSPTVILKSSNGLDRELPSAYPLVFYWQLEFPVSTSPVKGELVFEDQEARWHSSFTCEIQLAPGVKTATALPGSFEFPEGRGSFRTRFAPR
jgi:hypothetical protein